jgi:hypothetical protein
MKKKPGRADGKKRRPRDIATGLYTTEAGASRKRAEDEQEVDDPTAEAGEKAIEENVVVEDDDGEPE